MRQQDPKTDKNGKGKIIIEHQASFVLLGGLQVMGLICYIHNTLHSSSLFLPGFCGDLQKKSMSEGM